jgi:hypothetical protein
MNNPNNKLFIRPLIFTALLTAILMMSFEIIKQLIHENITIWESHLITIFFTTIVSVIVTYFALIKYYSLLRILSGFIPICSNCKKIREDNGNWVPIERYIYEHSNAVFTHGLCPECGNKYLIESKKKYAPN